ncbi:hypothetical protein ACLQ2K_03960 [Streptomyces sp. DT17]
MTFVADDAALATGDGGFSGDAIGFEPQLGKPTAESTGWNTPVTDDGV